MTKKKQQPKKRHTVLALFIVYIIMITLGAQFAPENALVIALAVTATWCWFIYLAVWLVKQFIKWAAALQTPPKRQPKRKATPAADTTKRAPATKSRSRKTATAPQEIPEIVGELDFDIVPDREIEIEYRDAYGDVTRRAITAQRIQSQQDGAIFIIGFCHLRQQMRSFRCDRIARMYFCGEPITINQFLTKVGFYQDRTVKESVAINKLKSMVKNMDESALDGFINS